MLGTKVVLRVNDFVLFCVYCPPSQEGYRLLLQYAEEAAILAQSSPVVFCGDFNLHITDDDANLISIKEARFRDALGTAFIRAYLGDAATRPANRADAVNLVGRNLDHFFVAGADAADGAVLVDFSDFSDHRPVIVSAR